MFDSFGHMVSVDSELTIVQVTELSGKLRIRRPTIKWEGMIGSSIPSPDMWENGWELSTALISASIQINSSGDVTSE